jgi:hypothetical protein
MTGDGPLTHAVTRAQRSRIARTIRAVGVVRADETRIRHVHTKTSGCVEKLYVTFIGEFVSKGQPILSLYSQELLATQQEYLRAREAAAAMQKSSMEPSIPAGASRWPDGAIEDLAGNVWEWVADAYDSPYPRPYPDCSATAPVGERGTRSRPDPAESRSDST